MLWAAVFLVASIIYRPVEQLLSRTIAERRARERSVGDALRVAATIQLGLAVAFVAVALLLREPIEDDLFSGDSTLYWCLIAAVTFYAASYFARGFLAGEQRFALYGGLVLMEASSRVVFVVLLAIGVVDSENVAAIAIAAAPLLSLFVVPWALGRHVRRMTADARAGRGRGRRAGVHALARPRVRGRGARDHVLRAGDPQLGRADREGRDRRRRAGGPDLRGADDRARAAAALPGGLDDAPAAPHAAARA